MATWSGSRQGRGKEASGHCTSAGGRGGGPIPAPQTCWGGWSGKGAPVKRSYIKKRAGGVLKVLAAFSCMVHATKNMIARHSDHSEAHMLGPQTCPRLSCRATPALNPTLRPTHDTCTEPPPLCAFCAVRVKQSTTRKTVVRDECLMRGLRGCPQSGQDIWDWSHRKWNTGPEGSGSPSRAHQWPCAVNSHLSPPLPQTQNPLPPSEGQAQGQERVQCTARPQQRATSPQDQRKSNAQCTDLEDR